MGGTGRMDICSCLRSIGFGRREAVPMAKHNDLTRQVKVAPYGVLGLQLTQDGKEQRKADLPDSRTAIVDPAGLHHIHGVAGPRGAGGAAGAVYRWLGIDNWEEFPAEVREGIQQATDAKYVGYPGSKHVIHCVGPDFREPKYAKYDAALKDLTTSYLNIFHEFGRSRRPHLRLLPVSGSIFAGCWRSRMPNLTLEAMSQATNALDPATAQALRGAKIELCIFAEVDLPGFQQVFADESRDVTSNQPAPGRAAGGGSRL